MKLRLAKGLMTAILAVFTLNTAIADDSITLGLGTGTKQVQESINIGTGEYIGVMSGDQLLNDKFVSEVYTESLLLRKDSGKIIKTYEYKDLTIEGQGQVVVAGKYNSSTYAGITAGKITVKGDDSVKNLIASSLLVKNLEVEKGNVELHTDLNSGGQFTGGNAYVGYMPSSALGSLGDSEANKQVTITDKLTVSGGSLTIGVKNGQGITSTQHHYQSAFGKEIYQSAGIITVHDMSLVSGNIKITQEGGTMSLSATSNADAQKRLTLNSDGTATITQSGDSSVMSLGTLSAYNKGSNPTKNVVNVIQNGDGEINMLYGADFTSSNGAASNITQNAGGTINLGGSFENVSYNITQSGQGGEITLKNGAVMIVDKVKQTADAKLTVESGAKLTADSVTINGKLANNGSITISGSLVNNGTIEGNVTINGSDSSTFSLRSTDAGVTTGELVNSGTIDGAITMSGGTLVLEEGSAVAGLSATGGDIQVNGDVTMTGNLEVNGDADLIFADTDTTIDLGAYDLTIGEGANIAVTLTNDDLASVSGIKLFSGADTDYTGYDVTLQNTSGETIGSAVLSNSSNGDVTITVVPEPTTTTLSLLALVALASRRRRK